jgi:hypothetical protein
MTIKETWRVRVDWIKLGHNRQSLTNKAPSTQQRYERGGIC